MGMKNDESDHWLAHQAKMNQKMNQCGKGAKERNTHQVKWERKGTHGCFTNSLERSCFTKANG